MTKEEKYFARVREQVRLKKLPGNCARCGKPHDGKKKTCQPCLDKVKELHGWKKARYVELRRRIESLELAVARIQTDHKKARNRAYSTGYEAGAKRAVKVALELPHYDPPTMSMQELATMNHAYDDGKD